LGYYRITTWGYYRITTWGYYRITTWATTGSLLGLLQDHYLGYYRITTGFTTGLLLGHNQPLLPRAAAASARAPPAINQSINQSIINQSSIDHQSIINRSSIDHQSIIINHQSIIINQSIR